MAYPCNLKLDFLTKSEEFKFMVTVNILPLVVGVVSSRHEDEDFSQ